MTATPRRVETLQYLVRCGYAVTASSSVSEALEIMRYVTSSAMAPRIVIIAEHLACEGGALLRGDLDQRFAGIRWVPYPRDCSLCGLAQALGSVMEKLAAADARMDSL
jgi:hypothetical protein